MLKLLIFAAAAYFLYKLFANDFFKKKKADEEREKAERDTLIEQGEMVQDPECGVYILKDGAISVKEGDKVWSFCSYECRDEFLKKKKKELEKGGVKS